MKLAVLILNAIVIAAAAALLTLGRIYGYPGEWTAVDAFHLFFAVPCIAAAVALRRAASPWSKAFAAKLNALWAIALVLLGSGVATGIGGAVGLLIVIGPMLLLLGTNWRVLRAQA